MTIHNAASILTTKDKLAAARAMLAALVPVLEAMEPRDGAQTIHMGKATVDALFAAYAQAETAGIKAEG
jgi:hypothetical protein